MFEGKLVRLRAPEDSDLEAEHALACDEETLALMTSGLPLPSSYSDARDFLSRQTKYTRGEYQFAVETKDGGYAGRCGVIQLDWKNRQAELAIALASGFRGRGYGREAMAILCGFCFNEMGLHKLKVSVLADNAAAVRCYEANGFSREGVLRNEVWRGGAWHDVLLLARFAPGEPS